MAGFPYTVAFADALAARTAEALWPPVPKKGLITDLDDTLWRGLVGEIGPDAVTWSQESHAQTHGLYQQMLGHLASSGVLVAICSKNEPSVVEAALRRRDLFVAPDAFFPIQAGWGAKSRGVERILRTWNIAADAVVFVDDSPMEIEEVRSAHPGITGVRFDARDPRAVWRTLEQLQELFGKPALVEEDRLRAASIRAADRMTELARDHVDPIEFLRGLEGRVTVSWEVPPQDARPLELVNKTNQFNLNGLRISEGEWRRELDDPASLVMVVSYEDKFGPLGKIAVLKGRLENGGVRVTHWVMSCRAFSRRIEHHTLDALFRRTGADETSFEFRETERNGPLREFFDALGIPLHGPAIRLTREEHFERIGELPHALANPQDQPSDLLK
jgi:FkbH-like protein